MYHPHIDAWLQSREEVERLEELERKAADAWLESLKDEQRLVFFELLKGRVGFAHLHARVVEERIKGRVAQVLAVPK